MGDESVPRRHFPLNFPSSFLAPKICTIAYFQSYAEPSKAHFRLSQTQAKPGDLLDYGDDVRFFLKFGLVLLEFDLLQSAWSWQSMAASF